MTKKNLFQKSKKRFLLKTIIAIFCFYLFVCFAYAGLRKSPTKDPLPGDPYYFDLQPYPPHYMYEGDLFNDLICEKLSETHFFCTFKKPIKIPGYILEQEKRLKNYDKETITE